MTTLLSAIADDFTGATDLANTLVRNGIVVGGETSGAVVSALGIRSLHIGPEIAPGVPWTQSSADTRINLALKSGNFGNEDFFSEAFEVLGQFITIEGIS
jgi:uncharacterized protein YgbK (DUF1537 family)